MSLGRCFVSFVNYSLFVLSLFLVCVVAFCLFSLLFVVCFVYFSCFVPASGVRGLSDFFAGLDH